MKKYSKFFVALSGVLAVVSSALSDGEISGGDAMEILLAAAVAFGVFRLPNVDPLARTQEDVAGAYLSGLEAGARFVADVPAMSAVPEPEPEPEPRTLDGQPKRSYL